MSYDYDNTNWFKRLLKHVHKYHEQEMLNKERRERNKN